jgi:hypothetical protein
LIDDAQTHESVGPGDQYIVTDLRREPPFPVENHFFSRQISGKDAAKRGALREAASGLMFDTAVR